MLKTLRASSSVVCSVDPMRHRLSLILTLTAWLLATGSHWDLVQTFAWGRMIVTSAQSMPLLSAVKRTFTPEAMCDLCHVVAAAKQDSSAKNPAVPIKAPGKVLLLCSPTGFVTHGPVLLCAGRASSIASALSAGRDAPPSPPPRDQA